MPKSLAQLTDMYYEEPVPQPLPVDIPRVIISSNVGTDNIVRPAPDYVNPPQGNAVAKLTGNEGERYQLWPEKVIRDGLKAAGEILSKGTINPGLRREDYTDIPAPDMPTKDSTALGKALNIAPVAWDPQDKIVEDAQAMSALAGSGGLAGTGAEAGMALGAGPSLRPALKYKDRLYKGKEGQQHLDVIPADIYPTFQKKAMSGEDIDEFNFGFINDKGQFLSREKALEYGINTGLIDPQAGKFGALTSTLMADSSKPGTAIEAMAKTQPKFDFSIGQANKPTFYSAVEHNVNSIPQSKMTGDQWLGTLANKPGVKGEELDWTGLKGFLEENKGKPVTKEQIQEHLAANKVELKEVVKDDLGGAKYINSTDRNPNKPRYTDYQLPGATNYREVLLTLPNKQQRLYEWEYFDPKTQKSKQFKTEAEAKAAAPEGAVIIPKEVAEINPAYRSSHWDEPNILAHVRMNDRTIDGKKSLHVEEIQSDWHQQGRDKGYNTKLEISVKPPAEEGEGWSVISGGREIGFVHAADEVSALAKAKESYADSVMTKGVPDAPFKKTWHELALKRMLREAAEKGYDRLSWTPGEAQAARYDLSKQVDNISYLFNKDKTKVTINAGKNNGEHVFSQNNVPVEKVSDYVGKELAQKIKDDGGKLDNDTGYKVLSGVDLKIGGEGMKGFYDQIIPKALEKLGKEHGVKVKHSTTDTGKVIKNFDRTFEAFDASGRSIGRFQNKPEAVKAQQQSVFYIDIPSSLKDQALQKGFPLFSAGGYMLMPVPYIPEFEKKQ